MKNSITIPSGCIFTGIGGTVTSLAAILQGLQHYDENKIHGYRIKIEEVKTLCEKLQQMEAKEVEQLIPFNPIPANLLLTGITLVIEIIAYFKTEAFFVSDRTWQFGVLEEIKQEMTEND